MKPTITTDLVVAYAHCPRKAYLLLVNSSSGTPHEYMQILEKQRQVSQANYLGKLAQSTLDVQPYATYGLASKRAYLTSVILSTTTFEAACALLTKVASHSALGHYSYEPTIFVGTHKISQEQKLALFFTAYVLEQLQKKAPTVGHIIDVTGKAHKVTLTEGVQTLQPVLEPLQEWITDDALTEPPLILNRHCSLCQFRDACRTKAEQENNLSLLANVTPKIMRRYEKQGIFTVKQLSYTFKPRKRKKRTKNPPPLVHKLELQALAIREQKIYLQELPNLSRQPVELFLDIEGIPDQDTYYLIGLLVCEQETSTYHSFWADTIEDEAKIWQQFLEKATTYPEAPIYHYGSYEVSALQKLAGRYSADIDRLVSCLVNVNSFIYGKVYFPIYSNGLKEIGKFIGATWARSDASSLESIVWRYKWENSREAERQDMLLTYNQEDCKALKLLADELSKIKRSADTLSEVDFADNRKRPTIKINRELHSQFGEILRSAHFEYDEKKISFSQEQQNGTKRKRGGQPGKRKPRSLTIRPTKTIKVPHGEACPKCGHQPIKPSKEKSRRLIIDLLLTKTGIKKTVIEYMGNKDYCPKCHKYYSPPEIRKYERQQLYGHGFKAWLIYQRIALRLPYESILESLEEHFNEKVSAGRFVEFVEGFANYYANTEQTILKHLLESPFVHVDETKFNILGANWYVWVFTNEEYVIFKLNETREAILVHDLLDNYKGILISDFYSGYDSVSCRQQKCWVHLIRDLNDDLRENPFDSEYESFVLEVRNLIVPIMEAVQKYGLNKRNLNKFSGSVDKFYQKVITNKHYRSDLTITYQKRFIRYKESLFTFLKHDGIPWHNNTAERAIRHVAKQRTISTTFHEASSRNYLRLLGIYQTCRFQGKSFFKFLFSGETDLDKFQKAKRSSKTNAPSSVLSQKEMEELL